MRDGRPLGSARSLPAPTEPARPLRLLNADFVSLLLAQLTFGFSFSAFFLLPKFMAVELAASPSEIGSVMGAFGLATVCVIPLVGIWVDRMGRRRFMFSGGVLMAASAVGFLWVESVGPLIYALRALSGVAFALYFVSAATLAATFAPPKRLAQALGIFGVTMLSMNAVAPTAAEALANRFGWEPVFWMITAAALAGGLLALRISETGCTSEPPSGLLQVLIRPAIWPLAAVVALGGAGFGVLFTFHQPYALEVGIREVRGFFIAYALAAVVVRTGFGWVADRYGRYRVGALALLLYGAAPLGMIDLEPGTLEWVGALFGLAHGALYPALNAIVIEAVGEHDRGKATAIYNGSFNAGFGVGAFALGFVAESRGYPQVFAITSGVCWLGLAVLLWAWGQDRRRTAELALSEASLQDPGIVILRARDSNNEVTS